MPEVLSVMEPGGEVRKTSVTNLNSVTAGKCAGGFAGYFGSGTLANVGGIKLLGFTAFENCQPFFL